MRKLLLVAVLALGGVIASSGRADAWHYGHFGPYPATAAFPCANPPGWYTNTYSYAWYYPWFAYYNYSHGPYANWMSGGGFAWYSTCGAGHPILGTGPHIQAAPPHPPKADEATEKKSDPAKLTIELPADARLLFNGVAATGTGSTRAFATGPLQAGQDYGYELTAEVVRDGRVLTVTERVIVRAGESARVTLAPGGVVTASAK
jgi:uncharacterized protein (TIGR03000 family)